MNEGSGLMIGLRYASRIIPKSIPLALRLGGTYAKFKWNSRKGIKTFENELKAQGLDDETTDALTQLYKDGAKIPRPTSD